MPSRNVLGNVKGYPVRKLCYMNAGDVNCVSKTQEVYWQNHAQKSHDRVQDCS